MTKARARLALLSALAVGVLAAVGAQSASAHYIAYYNCVSKPVAQWCDGQANGTYAGLHSWDYNEGWDPGAQDNTVIACEHVWKPSSGNELAGSSCGYNFTSHYYGDVTCACYEAEVKQYSSGNHSINGMADAEYL